MVYHTISINTRERALALLRDGWQIEETAETLGICPKSITPPAGNT